MVRYAQGLGIDEPLAMLRGGLKYYYHADGLGPVSGLRWSDEVHRTRNRSSITSLTNTSGTVARTYVYDSFGQTTASTGSVTNPFRYTAREFDPETDFYYYRARYYDRATGRFLSEDPVGFAGGRNFFVYAGSSPTTLSDPLGLKPCQLPIVPKDPSKRRAPELTVCPSKELDECLIQTESSGNSKAVSPKGAKGKRQVMPIAIKELQMQSLIGDTYDIDEAGLIYLKLLLTSCDTTTNAIAAYNGGVTAVNNAGGIPDFKETKDYVKKIGDCLVKKGLSKGLEDPNATQCCSKTP
ncbi:MAG: transglycosylase SLT domain-containing protein [Acidobacteria bacterium]|nr:transglycosylase SLT domain-containing protein [Acidobacteriota bacterium]